MKIDIFSGFLGSGKTTLIKKLIKEGYNGEKVVLIENEFGEIGIDGGFLRDAGIEITEMNSGCICCSLVGDFSKALKKVTEEFNPDRIVIEPSGVGKLSDVEKAVIDGLGKSYINTKTTVINGKKCILYAKNFGEFFLDQLTHADCVVLSHVDECDEKKLATALAFVKEHNENATIIASPLSDLDGKDILSAMESPKKLSDMAEELISEHHHEHGEECTCGCHHHEHNEHNHGHHEHGEECTCGCQDHEHNEHNHGHHEHGEECTCGCHHHEHHHGHHADEVFVSWGKETVKVYTEEEIGGILAKLSDEERYGIVLRAKGIVRGKDGWIHFDFIPDGIDVRKGSADVVGKVCVIGSQLNESALSELFKI